MDQARLPEVRVILVPLSDVRDQRRRACYEASHVASVPRLMRAFSPQAAFAVSPVSDERHGFRAAYGCSKRQSEGSSTRKTTKESERAGSTHAGDHFRC
jgi:hypothetical protein